MNERVEGDMSELKTGPISHDEAKQIASRFNASHWDNGKEKARYTIPPDARRDDDIRLNAYIDQQAAKDVTIAELRAEVAQLREDRRVLAEEVKAWREHKVVNPISLLDAPISRASRTTDASGVLGRSK